MPRLKFTPKVTPPDHRQLDIRYITRKGTDKNADFEAALVRLLGPWRHDETARHFASGTLRVLSFNCRLDGKTRTKILDLGERHRVFALTVDEVPAM